MLTEKHLAIRRQHITGTDAAPIMGVRFKDSDRDVIRVYREKRGEAVREIETNIFMRYGTHCEPFVLEEYLRTSRRRLAEMPEHNFYRHPDIEYIGGSVDAITDDGLLVEIKCPNPKTARLWGENGDPSPKAYPEYYGFQVQHYLLCTGLPRAVLVAYFGGDDLRVYPVRSDDEIHAAMLTVYSDFWRCVCEGREPWHLLDMSDFDNVRHRWRTSCEAEVVADEEILEKYAEACRLREEAETVEAKLKTRKAKICAFLGENDTLTDADGNRLLTWKTAKPRHDFNRKRFQQEHPEMFDEYTETAAEGVRTLRFVE